MTSQASKALSETTHDPRASTRIGDALRLVGRAESRFSNLRHRSRDAVFLLASSTYSAPYWLGRKRMAPLIEGEEK
jgi:hypothetical protein